MSIQNNEELPDQWWVSITIPLHSKPIKLTRNYLGIALLRASYKIVYIILPSRLSPYVYEVVGNYQRGVCMSTTDQFSAFVRHWRKNGCTKRQYINYSWISRKPTIQLQVKYSTTFS
jgi:hypothetical protein